MCPRPNCYGYTWVTLGPEDVQKPGGAYSFQQGAVVYMLLGFAAMLYLRQVMAVHIIFTPPPIWFIIIVEDSEIIYRPLLYSFMITCTTLFRLWAKNYQYYAFLLGKIQLYTLDVHFCSKTLTLFPLYCTSLRVKTNIRPDFKPLTSHTGSLITLFSLCARCVTLPPGGSKTYTDRMREELMTKHGTPSQQSSSKISFCFFRTGGFWVFLRRVFVCVLPPFATN